MVLSNSVVESIESQAPLRDTIPVSGTHPCRTELGPVHPCAVGRIALFLPGLTEL